MLCTYLKHFVIANFMQQSCMQQTLIPMSLHERFLFNCMQPYTCTSICSLYICIYRDFNAMGYLLTVSNNYWLSPTLAKWNSHEYFKHTHYINIKYIVCTYQNNFIHVCNVGIKELNFTTLIRPGFKCSLCQIVAMSLVLLTLSLLLLTTLKCHILDTSFEFSYAAGGRVFVTN